LKGRLRQAPVFSQGQRGQTALPGSIGPRRRIFFCNGKLVREIGRKQASLRNGF